MRRFHTAWVYSLLLVSLVGCQSAGPAAPAKEPAKPDEASKPAGAATTAAKDAPPAQPAAKDAAGKPASGDPYKIGVTWALTGPLAAFGTQILPGIEIAVEDINRSGGVGGRPLSLVIEDSKGTPEGGVAAMRKVVDVDKVPIVITIWTNVVTAQMPLADQLKIPTISTVESPGLVAKSEYSYAHAPTFDRTLPNLRDHWKAVGVKRLFAFFPNNAIAEYYSPATKEAAQVIGAEFEETRFKLGDTDFRGLIARAKDFNPDAILIAGQASPDEGVIMKQIRELGIQTPFYTSGNNTDNQAWRAAVGELAEGIVMSGMEFDKSRAQGLVDAYKAKVGNDPNVVVVEVYDIVRMIAKSIQDNGYNAEGIKKGLATMKDFPMIGGGTTSMGDDHQSRPSIALYRITNGQGVKIQPGG
jgi:branched-chain amino acid transport system substrate-binding protein